VITSNGSRCPLELSLRSVWVSEKQASDGSRKVASNPQEFLDDGEALPTLSITAGGLQRLLPYDFLHPSRIFRSEGGEPALPCVFVSPYGGERTATLGSLWDKIALSDRENDVVDALRIISTDIAKVSMIGGEGPRQTRTAIVRSDSLPRPVPLRSFGDGLNRLFGIALSLVNAKDGLLLIDEFENGMHHTVQTDVWRAVFKLATRLDIQVVATSHSWDAVEAFQQAASETPAEGVLVRLSRKGEDIIPTVFREEELAIATRDHIEVR